jgi:hypothetical protein
MRLPPPLTPPNRRKRRSASDRWPTAGDIKPRRARREALRKNNNNSSSTRCSPHVSVVVVNHRFRLLTLSRSSKEDVALTPPAIAVVVPFIIAHPPTEVRGGVRVVYTSPTSHPAPTTRKPCIVDAGLMLGCGRGCCSLN